MIEEGLRTFIIADSTVAGYVSTRCYADTLPQDPTLPALVISRISGPRNYHTEGQSNANDGRFQIDSWATSITGARNLAAAVRKRLSGYSGTAGSDKIWFAFLQSETDMYDSETGNFRISQDYMVGYDEALT